MAGGFSPLVSILLFVEMSGVLGVLVAVPQAGIADIVQAEIYRKRYFPSVTVEDLKLLARSAPGERAAFLKRTE